MAYKTCILFSTHPVPFKGRSENIFQMDLLETGNIIFWAQITIFSHNVNKLYIILKHMIWTFQEYNLFHKIFKFPEKNL